MGRGRAPEAELRRVALSASLALASSALADELPLNPAVTQETIGDTICVPGWTKTQRPSGRYTGRLKVELIRREGLPEELLVDFQLDHRIPLALGGAPSDPRNFVLAGIFSAWVPMKARRMVRKSFMVLPSFFCVHRHGMPLSSACRVVALFENLFVVFFAEC